MRIYQDWIISMIHALMGLFSTHFIAAILFGGITEAEWILRYRGRLRRRS